MSAIFIALLCIYYYYVIMAVAFLRIELQRRT
jgi:hypothetical protein